MSASARVAIMDALAIVDDIAPSSNPPETLHPYLAWPVWTRTSAINGCFWAEEYAVYVCLPGFDLAATIEDADSLAEDCWEALAKVGRVSELTPVQIQGTDGGALFPALRFVVTI